MELNKMNILSLFDGISTARVALERAGIKIDNYYASEIDKYAIQIAQKNYPDTIQLGDIREVGHGMIARLQNKMIAEIDLMILGSPCQDLSIAKKNRQGLKGERSGLFYEAIRIHKQVMPKWFIYENVNSMAQDQKDLMLKAVKEIDPNAYMIMINAALVSAQNRKRIFITNIPNIQQPEDRGILLKDIIHETRGEKFDLEKYIVKGNNLKFNKQQKANAMTSVQTDSMVAILQTPRGNNKGGEKAMDGKTPTLSSSAWQHNNHLAVNGYIRRLTPIECCRLQSIPDNTTDCVSDSQAYKALGNGFNAEVIRHILSFIK